MVFTGSPSYSSSSSSTWCRDKPKKKQGPISPTTVRHKAQCVMSGSVTHFFFFFLEVEKFSSLALTISIVIAASAHMYSIHNWAACKTSSCVFSRGRQVEFCEIWEIIARGQVETRWAVAKWLQTESRSPPKCWCVLLLHVRRAGDYLFSVLWCLAVCTAWKELPESEANDWVPNEYLICGIRRILQLLKLTWLHLSEALLLLWPMYIKVLKIVGLHAVVLKISPTLLIIHCTVGKNRIFTFLIGFWQSVASQQGHGWLPGLSVQRSPCVRLHGCSSGTPAPDYEWLFVSVWPRDELVTCPSV